MAHVCFQSILRVRVSLTLDIGPTSNLDNSCCANATCANSVHFEVDLTYLLALKVHDYLITLPLEAQFIWKGRWSRVTFLWLFTRYSPILDVIIMPLTSRYFSREF
jgi:hypothetical protein